MKDERLVVLLCRYNIMHMKEFILDYTHACCGVHRGTVGGDMIILQCLQVI